MKPPGNFSGGPVTVGTSAVVVVSGMSTSILIQADHANTGTIYIGASNVASDGSNAVCRLEPGESISMDYNAMMNPIYAVATTSGQKVYVMRIY